MSSSSSTFTAYLGVFDRPKSLPKPLHAGGTHQASASIESSAERKILRYKVLSSASAAQGRVITSTARVGEVVVICVEELSCASFLQNLSAKVHNVEHN